MTKLINRQQAASILLSIVVLIGAPRPGFAQDVPQESGAVTVVVESTIEAVTVYLGRAAVTRTARLNLEPGVFELQFGGLPESIQPESLQARATGPVNVVGVDYEQKVVAAAPSEPVAELDRQIEHTQAALKEVEDERATIAAQEAFITAMSDRATDDASEQSGTAALDLGVVRQQLAFIAEERARLFAQRRKLDTTQRDLENRLRVLQAERSAVAGHSTVSRTAVVRVVATALSEATVELVYLVAHAEWEPVYNIRALPDGTSVTLEYDALLAQRTGEDWDDVPLRLSTAQPTSAANPPSLSPWYVDVQPPPAAGRATTARTPPGPEVGFAAIDRPHLTASFVDKRKALEVLAADAEVGGTGPSVTFQLLRLVTVKSNAAKRQRTRIASIATEPEFIHVGVPLLTDAVYIRGKLTNASPYQLLPGRASIFVGQDYVGPTGVEPVAPGGRFEVHFGIDPAVRATRQLVAKKTSRTGLFSGGLQTSYSYRLEIDNETTKAVTLELWDRYPVSRTDQIRVELIDPSRPLATDAAYVDQDEPRGLLKWVLNIPAGATGATSFVITYGVKVHRARNVEMTRLPE